MSREAVLPTPVRAPLADVAPDVGVLTVDDQDVFRSAAQEVIAATPGFATIGDAASGPKALELVQLLKPDLILIDVRMPGIDGVETSRRIREQNTDAVVILISLDDPVDVGAMIANSGAVAFLRKQDFRSAALQALWATHGQVG